MSRSPGGTTRRPARDGVSVVAAIAWLAGCAFDPRVPSAPGADALTSDAADAQVAPCRLVAGAVADGTALGGDGGSDRPSLACAADEVAIGIGFDVSSRGISNHDDQIAMVNVHARCGRVERGTDGVFRATPTAVATSMGGSGGNCSAYFPTVAAAEVRCPNGSVLVGLTGNRVDSTLYNTVALVCAELDAAGAITGATIAVPVLGTGSNSNQPQTATCPAASAITGFAIRSGCGQDRLLPRCAPTTCQ